MKIAHRYTYAYEDFEVEVELRISGDHQVEVQDIFGVKDASGEWVDVSDETILRMMKAAVNVQLETEGDDGEWDDVIDETRIDAQEEEPEPTWGHGPWCPASHSVH